MTFFRPGRLRTLAVCLVCGIGLFARHLSAQQQTPPTQPPATGQPPQQQPPPQQPPPQPPQQQPPQQKKANPFETVPQAPETPAPKPAAPTPEAQVNADRPPSDTIESIEFRGARRVPQDTLRAMIISKKGDTYDEESLHRDFMALWNTARFDDIRMEREVGKTGWVVRFTVVERRIVRSIKYDGLKSITQSEILDRFKERKVGLSVESQYDPNKIQRARNVLQDYLAERGRQFATVNPEIRQVPPSSLELTFKVNEGPKVKVHEITFDGNNVYSDLLLKRAMKNLHGIGIPYSIYAEDIFSKTYDSTKLEEDQQRIEEFYKDHGYFSAHTTGAKVTVVDTGAGHFRIPLIFSGAKGKGANIHISIEEGRLYHLNNINFVGVKLFRTPETLMRPVFQMSSGDVFSTSKLRKGFEELRKLYGNFGYIDFVAEPNIEPVPNTDKVDLTLNFDEGKQFFVRRIDFSGNTTTRDKIIRREFLVDEGDIYNTKLMEVSLLRLNQLGYFEVLKIEDAVDIKRDTKTDTVDITLKVKERGKNSIQLNGGISGIAGSFIGFSYSTNNLLGLGETLSLNSQLGTRQDNITIGFTEPYFLDKPIQVGVTVFYTRFDYNQAREASILAGQNLTQLFSELGSQNLLNYVTNSRGFTAFISKPLRRTFGRVGVSYGYSIQNVTTLTNAATAYYTYIDFLRINGPNPLSGITQSSIIPSYTYNSVNHPITPTGGKSLAVSVQFSGSFLGGNVNQILPTIDGKYFHRSPLNHKHVIGAHILGKFVTGYGGKVAPPLNRFYMGGENDIRGFDIWSISPVAYIPTQATVDLLNNDGTPRQQRTVVNGVTTFVNVTQVIPSYQLVTPGGDLEAVSNLEYRIPIFGPVILAAFLDTGMDRLVLSGQLKLNADRVSQLDTLFPEAAFPNRAVIAAGTQKIRMSTGLELQVMLPVVNAPFRVYWAYNPLRVEEYLQQPIVTDRSYFPNAASFFNSVAQVGQAYPFFERPSSFRFTIGRTF